MGYCELNFTIRRGLINQKCPYNRTLFELIDNYPNDKQVNLEARKADKNGHIFNYKQFSKSSVKYFTDALFGFMPECTDIVDTMQLMNFLLFDGQANAGK